MIESISTFIKYFGGIRYRTMNYIRVIPADRLDWSPQAGELTCGDIVRHLAAAEKMFVNVVVTGQWRYTGHEPALAPGLEDATTYLEAGHIEAMNRLQTLDDAALYRPCPTLNGPEIKAWRLLMAMVEHEVHHRSQLAVHLALAGVEPPQIYGLGIEDIIALTTGSRGDLRETK